MSEPGKEERRRSRRRSLPFVRSAVLELEGRNHIVALTDLGPEGAFLSTRLSVEPDTRAQLRIVIPGHGHEMPLPCRVVWTSARFDLASGRPAGLAVAFEGLDDDVLRRIEEFANEGFAPGTEPTPLEHLEYRIVERDELELDELNRMGRDGWLLTATLPGDSGTRMVFVRRL